MKRIIRLTESELTRIVRRVIRESQDDWSDEDQIELDRIDQMASGVGKLLDTDRESWEKGYDDYKSNYHDRWRELKNKKRGPLKKPTGSWSDEDQIELDRIDQMASGVGKLLDTDRESWEKGYDDYKSNYHDRWRELKNKKRNAGY